MKLLIYSFCGAFKAGTLPSDLNVIGLVGSDVGCVYLCQEPDV